MTFYIVSVTSVYDATVCFRETEPLFTDLLIGKPCVADFMIRRLPIEEVPTDEKENAKYIQQVYIDKVSGYRQKRDCELAELSLFYRTQLEPEKQKSLNSNLNSFSKNID